MFDKNSNDLHKVSKPTDTNNHINPNYRNVNSNTNTTNTKIQIDVDERIDMEVYIRDTRTLMLSDDTMNDIVNNTKPSDAIDIKNIFGETFDIVSLLMYLGLRYDVLNDNDSL